MCQPQPHWLSKQRDLFLWLAHLNNKTNVCKQISSLLWIFAINNLLSGLFQYAVTKCFHEAGFSVGSIHSLESGLREDSIRKMELAIDPTLGFSGGADFPRRLFCKVSRDRLPGCIGRIITFTV